MQRVIPFLIFLALLVSACAPALAPTSAPATEAPLMEAATEFPLVLETSTPEPPTETPTPTLSPTPEPTLTSTPLPPLELPTLAPNLPTLAVWDGLPTYLGDSQPGYYFRVEYDPELWALTTDQFGMPALAHRKIEYCVLKPTAGRGLPPNVRVEHDVIYIDNLTYDVAMAYVNDALAFITYQGSNGIIFTGFQLDFQGMSEDCRKDALAVLSTLQAVPISQATPQP
jgi:hypothetical protein